MLLPFAIALLSAAAPDTSWGTIRGVVRSESSGLPLTEAIVEIPGAGVPFVTTDSGGAYVLERVPAGRRVVRVHSIDYEAMELDVLVPARGALSMDVELRHRPVTLRPVNADGTPGGVDGSSQAASHGDIAITDFPALEGPGAPGLGGGGASSAAGADGDVLLVRGAAADLKLVLLDGAPVYAPFHMGGLIESFEPGLLSGARLYLGGAPARYDGGVAYVLDLNTRAGSAEHHSVDAAVDMLAARGRVEGPIWKGATFLLAGRAVHGASIARLEHEPFPYQYGDGLARVDVALGRYTLSATGFANAEGVRIDTVPGRENFARWSNGAGSVRLRGRFLGSNAEFTAALSDFRNRLPNDATHVLLESRTRRTRAGVDMWRDVGDVRLAYGYGYDRQWLRSMARERKSGEHVLIDTLHSATTAGWYVDGLWRASPHAVVRGGLRADMFSDGAFVSFSPRLSATWLLTDRAALTVAGGRYHQYVPARGQFLTIPRIPGVPDTLGLPTELAVASADHVSLGLDQELDVGVRLGLEGYYKHFRDVPDPDQTGTYASGVDVWVRRGTGPVNGWLGYSLAWYWSRPDSAVLSHKFQGRQILSAGLQSEGRVGRAELRVAYGSGLPYTAAGYSPHTLPDLANPDGNVDADVPLTGSAPEDFVRLDAQVSRTFTPRVADRETELTPYFRVMNGLDSRDALFYRYNPTTRGGAPRPIASMSMLPVLGLEWKF